MQEKTCAIENIIRWRYAEKEEDDGLESVNPELDEKLDFK